MSHPNLASLASIPPALYGTAWKEDKTEEFSALALACGFRGFDTANQRKHYYEEGLGKALQSAISRGVVSRKDLFLQSKFTYTHGQDHRLPYDPKASMPEQVRQSFASSLQHLGTDYLDSYLLHGPEMTQGLTDNDWQVWHTLEAMQKEGLVGRIGVSNMKIGQLRELCARAAMQPNFVQNRCYPSIGWDGEVRAYCREHGITYQGFNLIRDPVVWQSKPLAEMAARYQKTMPQLIYRWAKQVGILPISGNTQRIHIEEALAVEDFTLSPEDAAFISGE